MIGTNMPEGVEAALLEAFAGLGYDQSLIRQSVDYDFDGQSLGSVQMAAFWRMPPDQFTSAVAVRWVPESEATATDIKTLGTQLWAPFGLVAGLNHCDLWDTLPASPANAPTILEESISYPDLTNRLKSHAHRLGREQVQRRKSNPDSSPCTKDPRQTTFSWNGPFSQRRNH